MGGIDNSHRLFDPGCTELVDERRMKLETWVDQDGGCDWEPGENSEPYSQVPLDWDPARTYRVRIEWE